MDLARTRRFSIAAIAAAGLLTPARVRVQPGTNGDWRPSILVEQTLACADGACDGPTCRCEDELLLTCDSQAGKVCRCAAEE